MFNISQFLERFKSIGQENALFRETIAPILSESLGVKISSNDFKIQNNIIIFLKVGSSLKSQVFIKKSEILKILKEKFQDKAPYDIK